nr:helix-hairpin-helix domain-containing protein [uncultured Capnocytophaga sp.]
MLALNEPFSLMKRYTTGFSYWTKQQKRGVLGLLCCCILLQIAYLTIDIPSPPAAFSQENLIAFQQRIDSLKAQEKANQYTISPFNPNFISDYKAYILGISAEQLSRLQSFRETGKYVNSAKEFQKVTGVSDSLLATITPLFKFPDWVTKKKTGYPNSYDNKPTAKIIKKDLNTATAEDLLPIRGIGEKLSERILKYRERLGGFSHKKQLGEIYGLSEEVISEIWRYFDLLSPAQVTKIELNQASKKELSKIPYLSYKEVEALLIFRSERGNLSSLNDLQAINFSAEKIEQLSWYLKVEK